MKSSIWDKDVDYKSQPASDEVINMAEKKLGIKLPESYIKLLKEQNGGSIIYNAHPAPRHEVFDDSFIEVEYLDGIGKAGGILKSEELIEEWEMPKGLVLFNGDGHYWLAFDYRHTSSNPPIVYVDNNDEVSQVIKIAENFDEFLENLYVAEIELLDDEDYSIVTYSKEDFELLIEQDDAETLSNIIQFDTIDEEADLDWYSEKLLLLSNHPDDDLRTSIANKIWNNYTYQFSDDILEKFIEMFKNDTDSDVRSYADMITEKINYSLEDLKMEMIRENTDYGYNVVSSFICKEDSYHVIQQDNKWVLESHTGSDQSFDSIDQFFKQATLGGIPLTVAWGEVKKI